jgi:DNA replication initiation complex subunit (GINS family)
MIMDADDFSRMFEKVFEKSMRKAVFEAQMAINQKPIRYFERGADLTALFAKGEAEGGLNGEERKFYEKELFSAMVKEQEKHTGENSPDYHALDEAEFTKALGMK